MKDELAKVLMELGFTESLDVSNENVRFFSYDFDNKLLFTTLSFQIALFKSDFVDISVICHLPSYNHGLFTVGGEHISLFSGKVKSKDFLVSVIESLEIENAISDNGIGYCKYLGESRFLSKIDYNYEPISLDSFLYLVNSKSSAIIN